MRKYFIAGLLAILPISLTLYISAKIFGYVAIITDLMVPFRILIQKFLSSMFPGNIEIEWVFMVVAYAISLLSTFAIIVLVGILTVNYFGKSMMNSLEKIILKIPLSKTIYSTIKQISQVFLSGESAPYRQVVLMEYPKKGIYSVGFLTNESVNLKCGKEKKDNFITVFIPTSPNPTSGMLVVAHHKDIIKLDMKVEEAAKLIISGGAIKLNYEEDSE